MPKRYLLLIGDSEVTESDRKKIHDALEKTYGELKIILVQGNPRAMIVKSTEPAVRRMREYGALNLGGKRFKTLLTSGAVGNLKRRAVEANAAWPNT